MDVPVEEIQQALAPFLATQQAPPAVARVCLQLLQNGSTAEKAAERLRPLLKDKTSAFVSALMREKRLIMSSIALRQFDAPKRPADSAAILSERPAKRSRFDAAPAAPSLAAATTAAPPPALAVPAGAGVDKDAVKAMVANAKRMLEERARKQREETQPVVAPQVIPTAMLAGQRSTQDRQGQERLVAQLASLSSAPDAATAKAAAEAAMPQRKPELQANLRAQRATKMAMADPAETAMQPDNPYFDHKLQGAQGGGARRAKRAFQFHEKGKFEQQAQMQRTRAQLEALQAKIAQAAKTSNVSAATRLALLAPERAVDEDEKVPDMEWWDLAVLPEGTEGYSAGPVDPLTLRGITHLIEHPVQVAPAGQPTTVPQMPLFLTAKETKKLRKQRRQERLKEEQERVQFGYEIAPSDRLTLRNMMSAKGKEAVMDPTSIELSVRNQMAERLRKHEQANADRKLTDEERKAKARRKLTEDTSLMVHVAIYRVLDLSNAQKKFKVDKNAEQLNLTGCVILHGDVNVIVVEGGPKQLKKYKHLLLTRIDWEEDNVESSTLAGAANADNDEPRANACFLVWEGVVTARQFQGFKTRRCATEMAARDVLRAANVDQYWDMALSHTVSHPDD